MNNDAYDTISNLKLFQQMLEGLLNRQFGDQAQMYVGNHLAILPKRDLYKTIFITPKGVACRLAELASVDKNESIVSHINTNSICSFFQSKNYPYYSEYDECHTIFYSCNDIEYRKPNEDVPLLCDVFGLDLDFWRTLDQYRVVAHNSISSSPSGDRCYKCFDDSLKFLKKYMPLDPLRSLDCIYWDQL